MSRQLLLQMSRASIDRCLQPVRFEHPNGLSTTKPGVFLRQNIPVRTFTPWEDERPGFEEIDLVAHCGQTTEGQYLNTLTVTDIGHWLDRMPGLSSIKASSLCLGSHRELRLRLPFPLLGIDSDNGCEFINDLLYRYCLTEKLPSPALGLIAKTIRLMLSRRIGLSFAIVIGYDRYETEEELERVEIHLPGFASYTSISFSQC